jgi:AraC-like DNA-binding protein
MWKNDVLKTALVYIWHTRSDEPDKDFDLHCHREYEIYYLIEGELEFRIGNQIYRLEPRSLLLVPPGRIHGVKIPSDRLCHRVAVHFLPEMLDPLEQEVFSPLFYMEQNHYPPPDPRPRGIEPLVQGLLECRPMEGNLQPIALRCRIVSLLAQICRLQSRAPLQAVPADPRIQDILAYLNDNLPKPISLEKVSRKFSISKNHLNVIFKTGTGSTINRYIRMKRLALARKELASGLGSEEAALNAGFRDYSTFFRAYKALFGDPPSVSVVEKR